MKLLLNYSADICVAAGEITCLHQAAWCSKNSAVQLLLDSGADVNKATSVIVACLTGQVEVVLRLLDRGALIDAADTSGYTALHLAAKKRLGGDD